jgi:hypothetical protein
LPIRFLDPETVVVAVADPTDTEGLATVRKAMRRELSLTLAERSAIEYAMMHAYRGAAPTEPESSPEPPSEPVTADLTTLLGRLVVAVEDIALELRARRELDVEAR